MTISGMRTVGRLDSTRIRGRYSRDERECPHHWDETSSRLLLTRWACSRFPLAASGNQPIVGRIFYWMLGWLVWKIGRRLMRRRLELTRR